jgi:hypothetical protein
VGTDITDPEFRQALLKQVYLTAIAVLLEPLGGEVTISRR